MPSDYLLEDVQLKFQEVHNHIVDRTQATQDGIAMSTCCERLTILLNESHELSSLSIESIKLALQAIYSNVGASYALEAYEGPEFSRYALEDLSGFVKDLWTRVKTSMQTLWDKVTQFWEDNFSALKSVRASLQRALTHVEKEYHVKTAKQSVRLSDSIFTAFNSKKDVDDVLVSSFIVTHLGNFERLDEILTRTKHFNQHVKAMRKDEFEKDVEPYLMSIADKLTSRVFKFGHDVRPIIGGEYISVGYNFTGGSAEMTVDVDKTTLPVDVDKREIYTTDQQKLRGIIKRTIDVIDETIKYADVRERTQKEFDDLIKAYDKIIMEGDATINKNVNKTIKLIYKINSCMPGFFSLVVLSNVKLAKSVLGYASLCVNEA